MKHLMRSKINKRIIGSLKRISLVFFSLFLILSMGRISGTNSFFMDTAVVSGNTMTAGYWTPPAVSVTSPDLGDKWQIGSQHNITWTATSADPAATASMLINIDYKCGAGSYSSIATGTANGGTYGWIIPPTISNDCYVKITATDSHSLTNSAESGQFEISRMVVLNEFMPKPAAGNEWVEIYNNGTVPVDVNNWKIKDSIGNSRTIDSAHTNTGSTVINPAASRFLVIQNYASFDLNNDGDTVKLYDSNNNLIDSHAYTATDVSIGKSIARVPDGTGGWVDPVPTPGEKNTRSNDFDDFQKYYEEFCFDKKDKPTCDKEFMESLDLLKKDTVPVVEAPVSDTVPAVEEPADSTSSPQADPALTDETPVVETPAPPADPEVTPVTETEVAPDATDEPAVTEEKPVMEEKPAEVPAKEEEIKKDEVSKPEDNPGDNKESDSSANPAN